MAQNDQNMQKIYQDIKQIEKHITKASNKNLGYSLHLMRGEFYATGDKDIIARLFNGYLDWFQQSKIQKSKVTVSSDIARSSNVLSTDMIVNDFYNTIVSLLNCNQEVAVEPIKKYFLENGEKIRRINEQIYKIITKELSQVVGAEQVRQRIAMKQRITEKDIGNALRWMITYYQHPDPEAILDIFFPAMMVSPLSQSPYFKCAIVAFVQNVIKDKPKLISDLHRYTQELSLLPVPPTNEIILIQEILTSLQNSSPQTNATSLKNNNNNNNQQQQEQQTQQLHPIELIYQDIGTFFATGDTAHIPRILDRYFDYFRQLSPNSQDGERFASVKGKTEVEREVVVELFKRTVMYIAGTQNGKDALQHTLSKDPSNSRSDNSIVLREIAREYVGKM